MWLVYAIKKSTKQIKYFDCQYGIAGDTLSKVYFFN